MSRLVKNILWLNMAVVAVLTFVYADLMVSPGHVITGHKDIQGDCFACHTLFVGATDSKCIECHKVKDIGIRTTRGAVMFKDLGKVPVAFHQKLPEQECVACHSDHAGIAIYRARFKFSHALLDGETRKDCVACHAKPQDKIHEKASTKCSQCHTDEKWKPATFKHELLAAADLAQCTSCHQASTPKDKLHETSSKKCGLCHLTDKWKPVDFKHEKLPRADLEQCGACHTAHKPKDKVHEKASDKCGLCHLTEKWKPATFKHDLLPKAELEQCASCHKKPTDKLHQSASEKCGQCHVTEKWKPAIFKHEALPRAELRQCVNCHANKAPNDERHRAASKRCGNCHYTNRWEPAKRRDVDPLGARSTAPANGGGGWFGGNGGDDD